MKWMAMVAAAMLAAGAVADGFAPGSEYGGTPSGTWNPGNVQTGNPSFYQQRDIVVVGNVQTNDLAVFADRTGRRIKSLGISGFVTDTVSRAISLDASNRADAASVTGALARTTATAAAYTGGLARTEAAAAQATANAGCATGALARADAAAAQTTATAAAYTGGLARTEAAAAQVTATAGCTTGALARADAAAAQATATAGCATGALARADAAAAQATATAGCATGALARSDAAAALARADAACTTGTLARADAAAAAASNAAHAAAHDPHGDRAYAGGLLSTGTAVRTSMLVQLDSASWLTVSNNSAVLWLFSAVDSNSLVVSSNSSSLVDAPSVGVVLRKGSDAAYREVTTSNEYWRVLDTGGTWGMDLVVYVDEDGLEYVLEGGYNQAGPTGTYYKSSGMFRIFDIAVSYCTNTYASYPLARLDQLPDVSAFCTTQQLLVVSNAMVQLIADGLIATTNAQALAQSAQNSADAANATGAVHTAQLAEIGTAATNAFSAATNAQDSATNAIAQAQAAQDSATAASTNSIDVTSRAGLTLRPTFGQATNIAHTVMAHISTNNAVVGGWLVYDTGSNAWFRVTCSNLCFYVETY